MANGDWDGAASMHKALKVLATSSRPISASRVKTAASTALDNVKVTNTSSAIGVDVRTKQALPPLERRSIFLALDNEAFKKLLLLWVARRTQWGSCETNGSILVW